MARKARSRSGSFATQADGPLYIGVCGGGVYEEAACAAAEQVGYLAASSGAVIVCGGYGGVMEAACRGARAAGGLTIGILSGVDRGEANPYVDIALPTGLGEMRNALIVRASDAVIAISGEFGTLSEIALALKTGVPVIGLQTWELARPGREADPIVRATDPEDAIEKALRLGSRR